MVNFCTGFQRWLSTFLEYWLYTVIIIVLRVKTYFEEDYQCRNNFVQTLVFYSVNYQSRLDTGSTLHIYCRKITFSTVRRRLANCFPTLYILSKKYRELIIQKARLKRLSKTFLTLSWDHCPLPGLEVWNRTDKK